MHADSKTLRTKLRCYGCKFTGINFNQVSIYKCRNDENNAYAAVLTLLNLTPRPTAILAMSDMLAYGAFRAAEKPCLNIP